MSDRCAVAYRGIRERVIGLVTPLGPAADDAPVPATPRWSVHDLVAHLVGVARDAVDGRLDGLSTEAWTDAQVQRRRGLPREALLAEWAEYGPRFERRLARLPEAAAGQAVLDAFSHEQDLRHAIGVPGARTSDAVSVAFDWLCGARASVGAPTLRFVTEVGERISGPGAPVATVTASRFELLRASTGRRTREEVAAYAGASLRPELLLAAPFFTLRATSLREQHDAGAPRPD